MKNPLALLFLLNLVFLFAQETVSPIMMNQEIKHTLEENQRQKAMKKAENQNLVMETANKKQWVKLKKTVKKIQDRLSIVDFALQSIPTGVVMQRYFKKIKRNEQQILNEIRTLPPNLMEVLHRQTRFVKDLEMTGRLLIGIVASYGIINQMEKAERKIVLDYALKEVEKLHRDSSYTLFLIREAKLKITLQNAKLKYLINRDKRLVKGIINQIKKY